jgi:hypothetical protein
MILTQWRIRRSYLHRRAYNAASIGLAYAAAQRPASRTGIHAQVKLTLPRGQPLPRDGSQQLQSRVIVSRADVLDLPRPPVRGVYDLHRRGTRRRLHRPHIRHPATL